MKMKLVSFCCLIPFLAMAQVPCYDAFNGFYLGADIPYGVFYAHHNETSNWAGSQSTVSESLCTSQFAPGGRIGYGHSFSGQGYAGLEFSAHYLTDSIKSDVDGSFEDSSFFEHDRIEVNWEGRIKAHLGAIIGRRSMLYLIGGAEYLPVKILQSFKFTTGQTQSNTQQKDLWGWLAGLGMGVNLSRHWEMRLEATKSFFQKTRVEEVHPQAEDDLTYTLREVFATFAILYRF